MKKPTLFTTSTISLVIALSLNTTQALAASHDEAPALYEKPTFIGFSSGVVAGAIAAGPVGAVIAGTIGLLIGNTEEIDDQRQDAVNQHVKNQRQLQTMKQQKQQLLTSLTKAEQQNTQLSQQLTLASQTINSIDTLEQIKLNLQFKIGSSDVEGFYQEQVKQLAKLIKDNPNLTVHLTGHSDRNGDETKNLSLSEQRVSAVKSLLNEHGITDKHIITAALGESAPMQSNQTYQNDFYDRRVEIKLQPLQVLTAGN